MTFRNSEITAEADGNMTPNTSIEAFGRSSEHQVELDGEQLRDTHLVECNEASYPSLRRPSHAGCGAHGTQTVLRTEVRQAPSRIEEMNRDSFLRYRDEWVKNRARDIRQAGSASFNTCSEDTASITALNEFYRWRVFDGFTAEHRAENELKLEMASGPRYFRNFPKDVVVSEKPRVCRIVCRERGRRVFKRACHRGARS